MKVIEIQRKEKKTAQKHEVKEMLEKLKKDYYKPVKGMFEFVDAQGGWIEFTDRFFPGTPITQYNIVHGEICELPMGLVKRLNNSYKKIRQMNPEVAEKGPIKGVPASYEKISRVRFTPMDVL